MKSPEAALSAYLATRAFAVDPRLLPVQGSPRLVVVIPAMAEWPGLVNTLTDLERGMTEDLAEEVLVLVVVNHPNGAPESVQENNRQTLKALANPKFLGLCRIRLGVIDAASAPVIPAGEGVGTARKLGMDAAAAILNGAGSPWGGIICLDADTRVDPDYLDRWMACFASGRRWGVVCEVWHRPEGSGRLEDGIAAYECRLRCHELGLCLAGSPYGYPVVGSAMACSSVAYGASRGMKRRTAGEDFYFLQALAKTGRIEKVPDIRVYPAGRISERVPFGTGRTMLQIMDEPDARPRAYHPETYRLLRQVFDAAVLLETGNAEAFMVALKRESAVLEAFFTAAAFPQVWERISANHRQAAARRRAFHEWFDGFRTLKLIHFLRDSGWDMISPEAAAGPLLAWAAQEHSNRIYGGTERHEPTEVRAVLEQLRRVCAALCRGPWGLACL